MSSIGTSFENDVKEYGTQAELLHRAWFGVFENDVKEYGTQAEWQDEVNQSMFENDVKEYGTQAISAMKQQRGSLRMM